jgi:hypothetical protein
LPGTGPNCSCLPASNPAGPMRPKIYCRKLSCVSGDSTAILVRWLPVSYTGRSIDRRQARENRVALDAPLSFSFDRTLEQDERKQALLRAVERLPAQQKEVVTLKIWGELTFDEIARTLDESLNTVASRYRYALEKLKDWVPEEMEGKSENSQASR